MKPNVDLIVGIDLGTTYTGVSYWRSTTGQVVDPLVINKWPERLNVVTNKVPTVIAFAETKVTWGFEINQFARDDLRTQVEEYFKILLDHELLNQVNSSQTILVTTDRVQGWFETFLKKLYDWTCKQLEALMETKLEEMTVEYIFSVPAAWKEGTVDDYLRIIKLAGFGSVTGRHTASIGLNEAEAAAVETAIHPNLNANGNLNTKGYKLGDTLLVCDAGGGTTDVSILKVTGFREKIPLFHPLCAIDVHIGSINIDAAFNDLVNDRLSDLNCEVKNAASGRDFQGFKTRLGTDSVDLLDTRDLKIKIPGLNKDITTKDSDGKLKASRGYMWFSLGEIEGLFDKILPVIYKIIDKQLQNLKSADENANVDYIILSGGLGSSAYIQRNLTQRYVKNRCDSITKGVKILIAHDPQLVVCKGLVLDRIHQIYHVDPIISHRYCRASYGFVYDMPYDKEKYKQSKHDRIKLKADGRYYLLGRIKWFIKRDDPVECGQFLTVPFSRNVDYKHPGILHHDIIRFDGKPEDCPDKFDGDSKKLVCKVWCNLAPTSEETKMQSVHKHYRHEFALVRWGEYLNVSYNIRVGIDSSGLRFQLLLNGQTDGSFEGIEVEWTKVVNALVARARSDVSSSISEVESEGD